MTQFSLHILGLIASCKSKICYHHDVVGDVRQTTANTNYDQRGGASLLKMTKYILQTIINIEPNIYNLSLTGL